MEIHSKMEIPRKRILGDPVKNDEVGKRKEGRTVL